MSAPSAVPGSTAPAPSRPGAPPLGGGRAWLVWGIGALVYCLTMFHRNSLGVAALEAQQRFDVGPALLSLLPMLQLLVYVLLQVPAGMVADRFGPRRMLTFGLLAGASGVLLFAWAPGIELAFAARILIGLGDAVVFLSVMLLAAAWFPRRWYPVMASLLGLVGGLGQVVSAGPLDLLLRGVGWTAAFTAAGLVNVLLGAAVLTLVRDRPVPVPARAGRRSALAGLRTAFSTPGPRIGMAVHFMIMSPFTMLAVLWGYPFLVEGVGLEAARASGLLTAVALIPLLLAPVAGLAIGRWAPARSFIALGAGIALSTGWLLLVSWPGGPPPLPGVVAILVVSAAFAGIAPAVAFDFARDGVPVERIGAVSGVVNTSGFIAVTIGTVSAGVLLDVLGGAERDGHAFQVAFRPITGLVLAATLLLAVLLWRARRAARASVADHDGAGEAVAEPLVVAADGHRDQPDQRQVHREQQPADQ
ncbi:MFS transporter [Allonocardiopsis opalescens]|uniref:Nitrate/nitrite transporter NarK n=1 Tax=Allonocardiopsis opalescens TaxID=1144618 RepID=A0A2T0QAU5_9ACTN|nr:MFS transporter [Allonocardiopsis opalescens]PRY00967.1 nitrate/nitrite transporter NarK [Allonocardiopsis opalescens]